MNDIFEMINKYPIGTICEFQDGFKVIGRKVVGYKEIGGSKYIIFDSGSSIELGRLEATILKD